VEPEPAAPTAYTASGPLSEDELVERVARFAAGDELPERTPERREPIRPRLALAHHRRSRSRESHRTRAGHRRATVRGGDSGDDEGPSDPPRPRRVAACALDLAGLAFAASVVVAS
jgi:hypothetical protein